MLTPEDIEKAAKSAHADDAAQEESTAWPTWETAPEGTRAYYREKVVAECLLDALRPFVGKPNTPELHGQIIAALAPFLKEAT